MHPQARYGLVIGAIVGAALGAFYAWNGGNPVVAVVFVPIGAVMGLAPWLLKPRDDE